MALEIFICYRRRDTGGYAGRLYDHLVQRFGKDGVLFDVSAVGTAELLHEWVIRVVPNAAVLLALIGDEWLSDRNGRQRLREDEDIVRLEIELALQHEIPIIPVMIDGAVFPFAADLPPSIRSLPQFKGYELDNSVWDMKLEPLMEAISSVTTTHVHILKRGVPAWNAWRLRNPASRPRLARGGFAGADFSGADFSDVDLSAADLSRCLLRHTNLQGANLSRATLADATLEHAYLQRTNLRSANLSKAVLIGADLTGADLTDANLNECDFSRARLTNCSVYGVSAWNTRLEQALQQELRLSRSRDEVGRSISVESVQTAVVVNLLLESGGVSALFETLSGDVPRAVEIQRRRG
jgi:Pentapeptide repeats (8 copies)/TIR domain